MGSIDIIANLVFPYLLDFPLYFHCKLIVNMKLDISRCNRITFKSYRLHRPRSFLMVQIRQNWHYWHYCVVRSLWILFWHSNLFGQFVVCLWKMVLIFNFFLKFQNNCSEDNQYTWVVLTTEVEIVSLIFNDQSTPVFEHNWSVIQI